MLLYKQYRDYIYLCVSAYGSIAYFWLDFQDKIRVIKVSAAFMLCDIILCICELCDVMYDVRHTYRQKDRHAMFC